MVNDEDGSMESDSEDSVQEQECKSDEDTSGNTSTSDNDE